MLRPHSYQPPEDGLPPNEVRFIELHTEPWPEDASRVRVHLEVTPFLERPNLEVLITDASSQEVSSINIIESIDTRMAFTMHLRGKEGNGPYTLKAAVVYPDIGTVDQKSITFETEQKNE